jgi:monovalent cation:H+ antiporter-2, CPA2 family
LVEHSYVFRDIAMVFAAALVCGFLAWRLRQPILLGYVLAGLLLSPLTPGPRVHDVQNFETMAEIGVVLLMFSVGIEFSVPELLKVKWVALVGAPLGILLCVGIGTAVGALLGWPLIQGVAVGCIISVASTMVLLRLLMDRGEMATEHGRLMVTLSLVEDLAVVVLTVVLPAFRPAAARHWERQRGKSAKRSCCWCRLQWRRGSCFPGCWRAWRECATTKSRYCWR